MKEENGTVVIFGGAGFIGSHLARMLIGTGDYYHVVLADIVEPDMSRFGYYLSNLMGDSKVTYINCDVRDIDSFGGLPTPNVETIINLAAVHREPGHQPYEYFETNILGAENVCNWAEKVGCERVVFTSSIAPYGPCEDAKTEESIPCPETAYGSSKLVAEKVHIGWQKADPSNRKLVVVRPGVVFGPGEGGNVTRLIRAVMGRYFFYMGNRGTIKAGIYIKELCHSILWALDGVETTKKKCLLYNATMHPAPSVEEYVSNICFVAGVKRSILSAPFSLLYIASFLINLAAKPLGIEHPFSPVRINKLVRSNNIQANILRDSGYQYQYSLQSALEDWKSEFPQNWK